MHTLLSLFPQLLFLAPLSATIIRVTVAAVFLLAAYAHYKRRDTMPPALLLCSTTLHTVLAGLLLVGAFTQAAALVGAVATFAGMVLPGKWQSYVVYSRETLILVVVMCISLVFTGAGAFAFDLPL